MLVVGGFGDVDDFGPGAVGEDAVDEVGGCAAGGGFGADGVVLGEGGAPDDVGAVLRVDDDLAAADVEVDLGLGEVFGF